MADEKGAVPTESGESHQSDASRPQTEDVQSAAELIASDLAKTDPSTFKKADSPEVAAQEQTAEAETDESTESTDEAEAESTETESQVEEPGEAEAEPQNPKTGKRIKQLVEKLKLQTQENEKLKAQFEPLRRQAIEAVASPQIPQRPPDKTPEHWQQQYALLKQQGADDNDPRVVQAIQSWQQYRDEVVDERKEQARQQREAVVKSQTAILNSVFDINSRMPLLKPDATSRFGVSVNWESDMGKTMLALAQQDGTKIANESMVLLYARAAEAAILRQQLGLEHQEADNLKRKLAEGAAKGTISAGQRRAPPPPKTAARRLDDLEKRAVTSGGKRAHREALAAAALMADLG